MPKSRFLFGRLNLIAEYSDKRQFLLASLRAKVERRMREHLWGFFDVEELAEHSGYVTGYLTKLRPQFLEEVGDLSTHAIETAKVPNAAVAKARFFLEYRSGLLAFQVVSRHIDRETFEEQFARLIEEGNDRFFVTAEVQTVEERATFLQTLRTFDTVSGLVIKLHPTNPHFAEIYRSVDERLKALKAKSYTEEFRAGRDGDSLRVTDDDEIQRKAAMAEDGYGRAVAYGSRNGKAVQVATDLNPVVGHADTKARTPGQVLDQLIDGFNSIMDRIGGAQS